MTLDNEKKQLEQIRTDVRLRLPMDGGKELRNRIILFLAFNTARGHGILEM
jgi:hypothetical protein